MPQEVLKLIQNNLRKKVRETLLQSILHIINIYQTMKMKWFIALTMSVGALLGFTSCQNDRGVSPQDPTDVTSKHTVTTEVFYLDEAGNLTSSLRAINDPKGTITGDGSYFHNENVAVTAKAKSGYVLHKLYEKNSKGGFTEANGVVNSDSKTINFKITDDMYFIAVFSSQSGSERGYQNLKIAGTNGDYKLPALKGKTEVTKNLSTIGEEVSPLKTATGLITGWTVTNGSYKLWNLDGTLPTWLTATVVNGELKIVAKPHIGKTAKARTATFKVGKNGTIASAPKVWRTITVTQNSYYESIDPDDPDVVFTYGDGTVANIPATLSTTYRPTGEAKDLSALDKSLNSNLVAKIPVYENGVKTSEVVEKPVEVVFGTPSANWLTKAAGSTYKAGVNNNKVANSATVKVEFKVDNVVLRTTTITATQQPRKYNVGGKIQ